MTRSPLTASRLTAILCLLALPSAAPGKKIIANGWDRPDTRSLRANIEVMERRPVDGTLLNLMPEAMPEAPGRAFGREPWQWEWLEPLAADLKATRFQHFTDCFVKLNANPGDVDWFDDAGWEQIVDHWRLIARVAKQGGVKGINFDPEPYARPYRQFAWLSQAGHDQHTFAEYAAKARERGAAVMRAVMAEYPEITIFSYFLNSINVGAARADQPERILQVAGYGLLPAFLDGWLDEVGPLVTLVDGCESAYMFRTRDQYLTAALNIKGRCQRLVSPENRAKYRAQVQVSFGVYLDAYANPPGSKYYLEGGLAKLRENLHNALEAADEYVWLWGEKWRWWPTENKRVSQDDWEVALPGIQSLLRFARDPLAGARHALAELGDGAVNLFLNGAFDQSSVPRREGGQQDWKEGGAPPGWSFWQAAESRGQPAWDRELGRGAKGSGRLAGVAEGCLIQYCDAEPGHHYAITAFCRTTGAGEAGLRVRWQTAEGKWCAEPLDVFIVPAAPADGWSELFGTAVVPDGAGRLVLLLSAHGQRSPDDACWYDDVRVVKLD